MGSPGIRLPVQLLLLVGSGFLLTLMVLPPEQTLWSDAKRVAANTIPIITLIFLVVGICGRLFAGIGIVALVLGVLRFIHDRKIEIMETPLLSSDAQLLSQLFVSPDMVLEYLSRPVLGGVICFTLITFILFFNEAPIARARSRLIALTILLFALLLFRSALAMSYRELPRKPWGTDPSLDNLGMMAYLIQDYLIMRDLGDTPVANVETIAATLLKYRLPEVSILNVKPDVILWLSESFFDPRIFKDVQACDQTPTFCELAAKSISGSIAVPTFAGGTIRTEFELLTGVPMATVEKHYFPYMSLTNVPVNSIAWELRSQGYDTVAVHNHKRGFWRRPVALKNLGFQRWIGVEDMQAAHRLGSFHADDVLTDNVVELLEESGGGPQLVFAISMQAHGPYGKQVRLPNKQVTAIAVPEQVRVKNARILQEYFFHLNSAGTELRRLVTYVESRERPTMVLFFGDHLPGLAGVYRDIAFDNNLGPRQQNTPFVIFSNFPLPDVSSQNLDLAAWQLAALTMKVGGLLGDGAFAWFDVLYGELDWSAASTVECSTAVCDALLQFQYQQLAGP